MTEMMYARHLAELGFLEQAVSDLGYTSELIERSEQVPYHTLLVNLPADGQGRAFQVALSFYPIDESQLEHSLLLQYFIALPFAVNASAAPAVLAVLPELNNRVVLGHFGLSADLRQLHYRYVQALPNDDILSAEKVADVLLLVSYTPTLFADVLAALADGQLSAEAARSRVEALYAAM